MATRNIKYKCPFCDERYSREDLLNHIEENHPYDIPEDFSPFRYVFNYVNKKPITYHGKCTECGGSTDWDENKGRYNRQCNKKSCHDSYVKKFEANMMKTRGVTRISATASGQVKMLANRKISGEYRFSNGQVKTYTGSYELKALEFMDKVMHINPDDIMCPGPILEYSLNGETHIYITDFYYQPYNLIIEVKDGGDNPNKRNMPEYRAKQIAKEKYIIKHTNYNYLRLTNNDLSQLLAVFANLKMQMVENTGERVIHINESLDNDVSLIIEANSDHHIEKKIPEKNIGYPYFVYGTNKVPNCCVNIKGYSTPFRARSTMIPLRYNNKSWEVFCKYREDQDIYIFPGGGWDPNESSEEAAKREAREEARINVKRVKFCGDMAEYNPDKVASWVRENIDKEHWWYGYYTKIYVGLYDSKYSGKIEEVDKDPEMLSGQWYPYNAIKDKFYHKQREAINYYINDYIGYNSSPIKEMMSAAGYAPVVGLKQSDAYITNNLQNNVFSGGIAITDGGLESIFSINKDGILSKLDDDNAKIVRENATKFYRLGSRKEISAKLDNLVGSKITEAALYEHLTGIKLYDNDQIQFNLESVELPKFDTSIFESYITGEKNIDNLIDSISEVMK